MTTGNTIRPGYIIGIEVYMYSLPMWRRVLARFFEKYKVTKAEYDEWYYKNCLEHQLP